MEVGMRANQDIEIGEVILQSLPPLSVALHTSFLFSHCSTCFAPLPLPHTNVLHCSPQCAYYDSALPISAVDFYSSSADLRAALRLIQSDAPSLSTSDRVAGGLLANQRKMTAEDDETAEGIKDGARAMAAAAMGRFSESAATAALCAVMTNAVEVRDESGLTSLGVAVYGREFSWINHSCSPNACYRISLSSEQDSDDTASRIVPYFLAGDSDAAQSIDSIDNGFAKVIEGSESCGYGPRITVRSIKRIKKGEEVTVAYTDLLQPKALRRSELWSKYRFICCCRRCLVAPPTYVDHALEEISVAGVHSSTSTSALNKDQATKLLTEYIDDAVADYLSASDAQSCSEKLERILTQGLLIEQSECDEGKAPPASSLHPYPLHHISLDIYATLASTYKTRTNNISEEKSLCDAFDMYRISAAYSLLLAGATNHLFRNEPSLVLSAANFWANAGESLVSFTRHRGWSEFMSESNIPLTNKHQKCPNCPFGTESLHGHVKQYADFENVSRKFLDCITRYGQNVWSSLVEGYEPLRAFSDPFDFTWLETSKYWRKSNRSSNKSHFKREYLFQLGVHCLLYGGYLGNICLGENSYLTGHVNSVLDGTETIDCTNQINK